MNTQLLHYLAHGDIEAKHDVERFEGSTVHFADGSRAQFDLIICTTGYRWSIRDVDQSHFSWRRGRPALCMISTYHRQVAASVDGCGGHPSPPECTILYGSRRWTTNQGLPIGPVVSTSSVPVDRV